MLLTGIAAILSSVQASATPVTVRWLEVGAAGDGTSAFIDTTSLRQEAGVATVRQRFIARGPLAGRPARIDQTVAYACRTRMAKELQSREFAANGQLLRQFGSDAPYLVRAGSLGEIILDLVC